MGLLNPRGILSAVEVAFYAPAFLVSVAICIKHGFKKNSGWFYLVLISIFRIIGASCLLYMETQNDYSSGLQETAAITSAVGTAPLLLALMGFLQRINNAMESRGLAENVFRPIHLAALVVLILAIVGGVYTASGPEKYSEGRTLTKVGSILFLVIWLALAALAILTASRKRYIPVSETKLMLASVLVLPFILVRVVYTIAVSFGTPGSVFAYPSPDVWVQAFMMFAMEAVVVTMYIVAGLLTPKEKEVSSSKNAHDVEEGVQGGKRLPARRMPQRGLQLSR